MSPAAKDGTRLTPDQILDHIHQLARDGEGADKRWALNQLRAQEATGVALPIPKGPEEIRERISRQLRGIGLEATKDCFRAAFPASTPVQWAEARKRGLTYVPVTTRELFDIYPECPRDVTGDPLGYPRSGSALAKKRWIADKSIELTEARKASERAMDAPST